MLQLKTLGTTWKMFGLGTVSEPSPNHNVVYEAGKAARDFTASVASAYRLSTRKITLSKCNDDLPV
jgi:hypothetical protein